MTTAAALVGWLWLVTWLVFLFADIERRRAVRGSLVWVRANALRSWARPLIKPLFYVAVSVDVASLILEPDTSNAVAVALDGLLWWALSYADLSKDDDDTDPWGGIKTRLTTPITFTATSGAAA